MGGVTKENRDKLIKEVIEENWVRDNHDLKHTINLTYEQALNGTEYILKHINNENSLVRGACVWSLCQLMEKKKKEIF